MNPASLVKNNDAGQETFVSHTAPLPVYETIEGTFVTSTSGNQANAVAAAAIPAAAGKTSRLHGFDVTGAGATGASVVQVTVSGTISGNLVYNIAVPAGPTVGITPLIVRFDPPIPASAPNVAITVSAAAFGLGNTNAAVNAFGDQR